MIRNSYLEVGGSFRFVLIKNFIFFVEFFVEFKSILLLAGNELAINVPVDSRTNSLGSPGSGVLKLIFFCLLSHLTLFVADPIFLLQRLLLLKLFCWFAICSHFKAETHEMLPVMYFETRQI